MNTINMISLLFEVLAAGLGVKIALVNKKSFGWLIALTFAIYVIYDLSRFLSVSLPAHDLLFLTASVSICAAIFLIANRK